MSVRSIARLGLMLAMVAVLAAVEQMLPPVPLLPPGVKLGLSNIVVMYCVFFIGNGQAVLLGVLKSVFVLLIRGPMSALLSISGGMLSLGVIIAIVILSRRRCSYTAVAVTGAVLHNVGQLAVYSFAARINLLIVYLPLLIISGVVAGVATGTLLRFSAPLLNKIPGEKPICEN